MMLIGNNQIIGSIGGGILEKEVIDTAPKIKEITIKDFSLSNEEGADLGMICGGTNRILFVPVTE